MHRDLIGIHSTSKEMIEFNHDNLSLDLALIVTSLC
jgi:hypothetical protein